jgi:integrase
VTAAKVAPFVPYDMRHTCLTRWAKVLDPFTLKRLAGHADLTTTMRYVHLNDDDVRAAMEKVRHGHKSGHTQNLAEFEEVGRIPTIDTNERN